MCWPHGAPGTQQPQISSVASGRAAMQGSIKLSCYQKTPHHPYRAACDQTQWMPNYGAVLPLPVKQPPKDTLAQTANTSLSVAGMVLLTTSKDVGHPSTISA